MTKRLLGLFVAALMLLTACSGGGDGATSSATPRTTEGSASGPAGLKEAPEGRVNRPKSGTYYYVYDFERINSALPNSTPLRASDDAQLARKIGYQGEKGMAIGEKSTEGPAVAQANLAWEEDRLLEVSLFVEADGDNVGCVYSDPIVVLKFPLKAERFEEQDLAGDGDDCGGTRTIEVVGEESTADAGGTPWNTWHLRIKTISEGLGLTENSVTERWLSPDLGTDVKVTTKTEYVNPDGGVSTTTTSSSILKSYPA